MAALLAFLRRFLALSRKEWLSVLKDPSGRAILVVPILAETLLFGYGATYDLSNVPYAVRDQSRSPASHQLLAHFDSSGFFQRVADVQSTTDIERLVNLQDALMVIQIGPRFEAELNNGKTATVQLILDARNSTTANTALGYVNAVIADFNAQWRRDRGAAPAPLRLETRAWFNPNLETRWNIIPALVITLSALQVLLLTALSVAREREQGTFDQLLVTPLTPWEIMLGKSIMPMALGLLQSFAVLLIARFWFDIPMAGSLFVMIVGLVVFVLAIVGVGLSVSALSATMQQATLFSFVIAMPGLLLSGFTTPVSSMSDAVQRATLINPFRYGIDFARRVYLEGVGLQDISYDLIPLMLIAVVTLSTAAWLFRHRLV